MKMTQLFSEQLEREVAGTRRSLERVPEGRNDWKPHEKSMPLGYLTTLVATMPGWISFTIDREELDIGGPDGQPPIPESRAALLAQFDEAVARARRSLATTNDDHLLKPWRLAVRGRVVQEQPRYVVLTDSVFSHLAHHRGQLTVYLRLLEASVPSIYGPSADEGRF